MHTNIFEDEKILRDLRKRYETEKTLQSFILYLILKKINFAFFNQGGDSLVFHDIYINDDKKIVVIHSDNISQDDCFRDYGDKDETEFNVPYELSSKYTYLYDFDDELIEAKKLSKIIKDGERDLINAGANLASKLYATVLGRKRERFQTNILNSRLFTLRQARKNFFDLTQNLEVCKNLTLLAEAQASLSKVDNEVDAMSTTVNQLNIDIAEIATKVVARAIRIKINSLQKELIINKEKLQDILNILRISADDLKYLNVTITY